jgi:acyl-coenzyme A synthetase/AMP-(fatty) acid ligase
MKEVKCKFVAVDSKTAPMIQEAIEICNFDCKMINVGDITVQDTIEFSDFSTDDGLGKYLPPKTIAWTNNQLFEFSNAYAGFPEKVVINPRETILAISNTSGSTGVPKGVVHSHFSYVSVLACFE